MAARFWWSQPLLHWGATHVHSRCALEFYCSCTNHIYFRVCLQAAPFQHIYHALNMRQVPLCRFAVNQRYYLRMMLRFLANQLVSSLYPSFFENEQWHFWHQRGSWCTARFDLILPLKRCLRFFCWVYWYLVKTSPPVNFREEIVALDWLKVWSGRCSSYSSGSVAALMGGNLRRTCDLCTPL